MQQTFNLNLQGDRKQSLEVRDSDTDSDTKKDKNNVYQDAEGERLFQYRDDYDDDDDQRAESRMSLVSPDRYHWTPFIG